MLSSARMSALAFSSLNLPAALLDALSSLAFVEMTPVQALSLPEILAGKDLIVQAEPGSGKTAAFGLGILAALTAPIGAVQALVLCPTRELAAQISAELRRLARCTPNIKVLTLCGGVQFGPQRDSLKQGAHIVVGTPGRIEEHLRKRSLELGALRFLVLDEADRMLEMGFGEQVAGIIAHAPAARQTLLFSATYPPSISSLSSAYQRDAARLSVPGSNDRSPSALPEQPVEEPSQRVEERYYKVRVSERVPMFMRWLALEQPESTLVFCSTRKESADVAAELRSSGWVAACIHGEMPQQERQHVMRLFANRSCSVLSATDVAARGWDITGLAAVVNLGLSRESSLHVHRTGRTGRSGRPGLAVSWVAEEDMGPLRAIERLLGHSVRFHDLPPASGSLPSPPQPPMVTLLLGAGKNKKLRPGDVLGALTREGGVQGTDVGAIQIEETYAYVAVARASAERALARLTEGPIKGRQVKVREVGLSFREP
jgi:ATP-independent RNA helicase DbpA